MRLSLVLINSVLLCICAPTVLLRSFPATECGDAGGQCVPAEECPPDRRAMTNQLQVQCAGDLFCCFGDTDTAADDEQEPSLAVMPLLPVQVTEQKVEYEVENGEHVDTSMVKLELLNDTAESQSIATATSTTSDDNSNNNDNIVFPDISEESDDRIKFIKMMYKKYVIDFKKYNANKNGDIPKRKMKYAVGYKSNKYCKLYEKFTVNDSLLAIPLLPSLFPVLMQHNHCSKPLPLIVGGVNATKGEFPHMAALGYDRGDWFDFLCGGSLISERYVITAAHCGHTRWGGPAIVRLGTRNLITDEGVNMDVEKVIIHPDYHEPGCNNDIALVKMKEGLVLSPNIRPACLPPMTTQSGDPGSHLTATGWGRTGYGLFASPNLLKVSLEVMNNQTCEEMFLGGRRTERLPDGIQSSMLCAAGYLDSTHDTCQGDSGGPLQALTKHSKCMYEIIGITSFGKLCGTGLPAIYTRVSTYVPWIEDIVWSS